MLIGLEGVDCAGKSTLAAAIISEIESMYPGDSVELIHRSQLKRSPLDEYEQDIEDYRPDRGRHLVLDRWHWGEQTYGPLYRGGSKLTQAMFRHIELFLLSRGGRVWNVTQPLARIIVRMQQRGEDYLQVDDVEHVMSQFERIETEAAASGGVAIPPEGSLENLAADIVRNGGYWEDDAKNLNRFPSYIGRRTPDALLIGEKRGGKPPYPTECAFLPVNGNSGAYLLEALPDRFWKRVGICNALEDDISDLVDVLAGPPVVALGQAASKHLDSLGIEHGLVPHPQKIRRFHNGRQTEYGELIAHAAESGKKLPSWPE